MKKKFRQVIKEAAGADLDLSVEALDKLDLMFESAVASKVSEEVAHEVERLNEEVEFLAAQKMEDFTEKLVNTLDRFCEEAMTEQVLEFQDQIMTETKAHVYENMVESIRTSLSRYGVDVNPEQENLVSEMADENAELKESVNSLLDRVHDLEEEVLATQVKSVFEEETSELTVSERSRLSKMLSESEFFDVDDAREKIRVMREHFLGVELENDGYELNHQYSDTSDYAHTITPIKYEF